MGYMLDAEGLREQLRNYFGTAMFSGLDLAIVDLSDVESASPEELIAIARKYKIDYKKYLEYEPDDER